MKHAKRILSLLLCLIMLLSLGVVVFATPAKSVNYVSLGDSTTMAFFVGTYEDDYRFQHYDDDGTAHISDYSVSSLFSDYLQEQGFSVNTTDLTAVGMRSKELHAILDEDYFYSMNPQQVSYRDSSGIQHDTWCLSHLDNYMYKPYTYYNDSDVTLADTYSRIHEAFTTAIENADIITYDLLNGDSLYLMDRLGSLIGGDEDYATYYGRDTLASLMKEAGYRRISNSIASLRKDIESTLEFVSLPADMITGIVDAILYTFANRLVNFSATVDWIYRNNPDVNLIVVSSYNPIVGFSVSYNHIQLNIGKLWDSIVEATTAYLVNGDIHSFRYHLADCSGGVENCIADFAQGNIMDDAYAEFRDTLKSKLKAQTGETITIDASTAPNIAASCQNPTIFLDAALSDGMDPDILFSPEKLIPALTTSNPTKEAKAALLLWLITGDSRGLGIHPSADGYKQKVTAIVRAYENHFATARSTYLTRTIANTQDFFGDVTAAMAGNQDCIYSLHTNFVQRVTPLIRISLFR